MVYISLDKHWPEANDNEDGESVLVFEINSDTGFKRLTMSYNSFYGLETNCRYQVLGTHIV